MTYRWRCPSCNREYAQPGPFAVTCCGNTYTSPDPTATNTGNTLVMDGGMNWLNTNTVAAGVNTTWILPPPASNHVPNVLFPEPRPDPVYTGPEVPTKCAEEGCAQQEGLVVRASGGKLVGYCETHDRVKFSRDPVWPEPER